MKGKTDSELKDEYRNYRSYEHQRQAEDELRHRGYVKTEHDDWVYDDDDPLSFLAVLFGLFLYASFVISFMVIVGNAIVQTTYFAVAEYIYLQTNFFTLKVLTAKVTSLALSSVGLLIVLGALKLFNRWIRGLKPFLPIAGILLSLLITYKELNNLDAIPYAAVSSWLLTFFILLVSVLKIKKSWKIGVIVILSNLTLFIISGNNMVHAWNGMNMAALLFLLIYPKKTYNFIPVKE